MQAFLNDPELKAGLIAEVRKHREQDQIIKGTYGKMNGVWKGCAVGCSIRSFNLLRGTDYNTGNHRAYEQFGVPRWLARLEDIIFEGLPEERAVLWPEEFLTAIAPGADLDKIRTPFALFVLRSNLKNFDHEKFPHVKEAIEVVIMAYESGEPSGSVTLAAQNAAAEAPTGSAACSAARSASMGFVPWAAAWGAVSSAGRSAGPKGSPARLAAREAAYVCFADKLIELLKSVK